jgi:flagellar basal body-associated protein FliL
MIKPLLVGTFVAIVVLTECLFAYFLIPSTADVENWAKERSAGNTGQATSAGQDAHAGDDGHGGQAGHGAADGHGGEHAAHEVEAELGKFNVVIHQPAANLTMRVNFHLIGTLPEVASKEFEELLHHNEHRLRDQVIFEIRNSRVEDLTDPGLALLKRKILAKSNELLGKPILHTVLFSDFSYIEQ